MTKKKPSLTMLLLNWILKIRGSTFTEVSFPRWEARIINRNYPKPARIPAWIKRNAYIDTWTLNGKSILTLYPIQGDKKVHIIYTHGGAYVLPLQGLHWNIIHQLIALGARVTVPIYGLAPEHTYRETYTDLEAVYRKLLDDPGNENIILCGDSAGGGLALGQAINYRELGLPLPAKIFLFSPWLDISLENEEVLEYEARDAMLASHGLRECGQWWSGGADPKLPLISPLYADLSELPPIDCFIGTEDLLYPDAKLLAEKIHKVDGEINLFVYPGGFHDFVAATFTREARDVFAKINWEISTL